jgi:hypothetical protein
MALLLNGFSQYGVIPYNSLMNFSGGFTLAGTLRRSGSGPAQVLLGRTRSGNQNEWWSLAYRNGRPQFILQTSTGTTTLQSGNAVSTNVWQHLAATWDGATMRLYVDGVQVTSQAKGGTLTADTTPISFGALGNGTTAASYLTGTIEDLRIYSRAMSANEIMTIYTTAGADYIMDGVLLRLPLNEGGEGVGVTAAESFKDIGINKINGNPVASPPYTGGITSFAKRVLRG